MTKGILLLAIGHPYYGNYALQLARSIKSVDPSVLVSIAHADGALSHIDPKFHSTFDKVIEIPQNYIYTNGIKDYLKAKTFLYELSPFQKTIFIDADVIWTPQKKVSDLFALLDEQLFTMSNRGCEPIEKAKEGFIHWATPQALMEKLNIKEGNLYNLASEFIYFKKCKEVAKLFKEAQKFFVDPGIEFKRFGHTMPDELAFEVALLKTRITLHASPFIPFYWEHFERKNMAVRDIYQNYYGYSIGGNTIGRSSQDVYNALANHYNAKFGVNGYFPARDKKSFLNERQTI